MTIEEYNKLVDAHYQKEKINQINFLGQDRRLGDLALIDKDVDELICNLHKLTLAYQELKNMPMDEPINKIQALKTINDHFAIK